MEQIIQDLNYLQSIGSKSLKTLAPLISNLIKIAKSDNQKVLDNMFADSLPHLIEHCANFCDKDPAKVFSQYDPTKQIMFYIKTYQIYISLDYDRLLKIISNDVLFSKLQNQDDFYLCIPPKVSRSFMILVSYCYLAELNSIECYLSDFAKKHNFNPTKIVNYRSKYSSTSLLQVQNMNLKSTLENVAYANMFKDYIEEHYIVEEDYDVDEEYYENPANVTFPKAQFKCKAEGFKKYPFTSILKHPEWFVSMLKSLNC